MAAGLVMTDRLTLTRAFEGAGLKSGDAERIATEIYEAIHDNVATKADIATLRTELRADIAALRTELKAGIAALAADMAALRAELKGDIATLRTELKGDIAALRTEFKAEIAALELRLTVRPGVIVAAVGGALFAALRYWTPHP
jgi:hypothetical protein